MNPLLLSMFADDQREAAAAIGEYIDLSLLEKIAEVFRVLPDPLLAADDVVSLLGTPSAEDVRAALQQLEEQGVLESDANTQRPFDPAEVRLFRLKDVPFGRLILHALEARLSNGESRYQSTCDGRLIRCIAEIDRLEAEDSTGQQRGEIRKHVDEIADGIRNKTQIPNSVLITLLEEKTAIQEDPGDDDDALESWTKITPSTDWLAAPAPDSEDAEVQSVRLVQLDFPFRRAAFDQEKTSLLVDGQQRTAALSLVSIDSHPVIDLSVNFLITDQDGAKEAFGIANNAKPIPTDFKMSLLASMTGAPGFLQDERVRALATRQLALGDAASPFYHRVKYPGFKTSGATPIAYNSLFQVVKAFELKQLPSADDAQTLASYVAKSFDIVRDTWPDEWGRRPQESKLMHGAGLRAMAQMMADWLQIKVGLAADSVTQEHFDGLKGLLGEMAHRVSWSSDGAAAATQTAKTFYTHKVQDRQNTNQDVAKLLKALMDEVKAISKKTK